MSEKQSPPSDDIHSPYRWTTHAQTSSVFIVPRSPAIDRKHASRMLAMGTDELEMQVIVLGNQWNTSKRHWARSQLRFALLGSTQLQREHRCAISYRERRRNRRGSCLKAAVPVPVAAAFAMSIAAVHMLHAAFACVSIAVPLLWILHQGLSIHGPVGAQTQQGPRI